MARTDVFVVIGVWMWIGCVFCKYLEFGGKAWGRSHGRGLRDRDGSGTVRSILKFYCHYCILNMR